MNFQNKKIIWGAVVIVIIIIIIGFVLNKKDATVTDNDDTNSPTVVLDERISVSDQNPGPAVTLSKLTIDKDSWVAVHEDTNGDLGNILGASRFVAGNYENINIELLRGTIVDSLYYVLIYEDDGDKEFDFTKDIAKKDDTGNIVYKTFKTISIGSRGGVEE